MKPISLYMQVSASHQDTVQTEFRAIAQGVLVLTVDNEDFEFELAIPSLYSKEGKKCVWLNWIVGLTISKASQSLIYFKSAFEGLGRPNLIFLAVKQR